MMRMMIIIIPFSLIVKSYYKIGIHLVNNAGQNFVSILKTKYQEEYIINDYNQCLTGIVWKECNKSYRAIFLCTIIVALIKRSAIKIIVLADL